MTGYSGTPLWKKLGYKQGMTVRVDGAPVDYLGMLALPDELSVKWAKDERARVGFVHLFASSKPALQTKLRSFRNAIDSDGVIWVSWPKKSSGVTSDITEDVVREVALPLGLVDIKVCAVDEVWSGLKLMIRKELR
jgi:hypothetical protein